MAVRLVGAALTQHRAVLRRSARDHGPDAAKRYDFLIEVAMQAIGKDPTLKLSRKKVSAPDRVAAPSHVLVYRIAPDGAAEVVAFVHDRMLLDRAARRATQRLPKP